MSTFGDRLKQIRQEKGMSQDEFATFLGTSKQVISRYENNLRSPKVTVVGEYAEKLGVPISRLTNDKFTPDEKPDDDTWTLRQEERDDPDRKALFMLSKYGSAKDIRQVNALIDALRALLYPARQAPAAFVFPGRDGKPLAQVTAARMWIRLMAAAGFAEEIPDDEKTCYGSGDIRGQYRPTITPHAMRHNFITMCWEQGVDIVLTMRMVGHTDYETTRNIYTHLSAVQIENARAQLDSMFSADSPSCRKVASPSPHPADT